MIAISAVAVTAAAWVAGNSTIAAISIAAHAIIWVLHAVEVKVNKLLDDRNLRITDEDLDR